MKILLATILKYMFDIPRTIWFNLKYFPFSVAIKLPVLIGNNVKICEMHRNAIVISGKEKITPFMIKIGVGRAEGVSGARRGCLFLGENAQLIFKGNAQISEGILIRSTNGKILIGNNFYSNLNLSIICANKIEIGEDVLLGWDINIRDCDGHFVYINGERSNIPKPVYIGDRVWIGAYVDILKGVSIGSGSIVAYRSCVLKPFSEENILIGGYPAKKLKTNIAWQV